MALGFNFSSGGGNMADIIPIVKYDARAGRMMRRDRVNGEYDSVDITRNFKAVMDLENIETGTINFNTGGAPDFAVARLGTQPPAPPSADHKPGVRMLVKLGKDCGGDIRELASTARVFLRGLDDLHTAYVEGAKANPGKLPVVSLKDTVAITTGEGARKSTNYAPVFEITGWVARPTDLVYTPKARSAAPATGGSTAAPSTGSTPVAAPAASEDDFG